MPLDVIEHAVNRVSDHDASWWPFLWVRPEQHARFSLRRLASVSLLYGLPFSAAACVGIAALKPALRASLTVPLAGAAFPLALFFFASVIIGPMWNRRAERLRARRGA